MSDVVVLIDREQGGKAHLAGRGLRLHAAFTLSHILQVLLKHRLVGDDVAANVRDFIAANQTTGAQAQARRACSYACGWLAATLRGATTQPPLPTGSMTTTFGPCF